MSVTPWPSRFKKLTAKTAREALDYDPSTGRFKWKLHPYPSKVGECAEKLNADGYWVICICYQRFLAHRLVWLVVHGEWPSMEIDHRNGDPTDNRLSNLRLATRMENQQNTIHAGVTWDKSRKKFMSSIDAGRKKHFLGRFDTYEMARAAYLKAKKRYHLPAATGVLFGGAS